MKAVKAKTAKIVVVLGCISSMVFSSGSLAGEADVLEVKVRHEGGDRYYISTTVAHGDTGWKHYANVWEVLDESGKVIGTRVLHHPHENEQPFTRSLRVNIPASVKTITVRAGDSQHAFGGKTVAVKLR